MFAHTVSVEPALDQGGRTRFPGQNPDRMTLAIVERGWQGRLVKVIACTDDYSHALVVRDETAYVYGANPLVVSAYFPTVVGEDIAARLVARRDAVKAAA